MKSALGARIGALRVCPPQAALARAWRNLRRAEIANSTALAGAALNESEVNALIDRGVAQGEHPLGDYLLVRDYARAAEYASTRLPFAAGDPRPLLAVGDVRQLQAYASASDPATRPGAWRSASIALADGVVAPAPWLVPREVDVFLERFAHAPADTETAAWIARVLARFTRILPFSNANGRVARLVACALLARCGLPPLRIPIARARAYRAALVRAHAGAHDALERIVERALVYDIEELLASRASGDPSDELLPLADLVPRVAIPRYYKAAQRGRLRHTIRAGRIFVTRRWLAEYSA